MKVIVKRYKCQNQNKSYNEIKSCEFSTLIKKIRRILANGVCICNVCLIIFINSKIYVLIISLFLTIFYLGDTDHENTQNPTNVSRHNAKEELKRVSFSATLTKTYHSDCYPSEEMDQEDDQQSNSSKPSFLVGDLDNGSPDEDTFEAKDDFPIEVSDNNSKMSAYERNLMEKRRRLRYVLLCNIIQYNTLPFVLKSYLTSLIL